ncbi:hypothetical protein B0T17DRAFT_588201 [Bombardia bombarda]|uniref:Uncharacterized protein n=1 Tax=Bombardia bombarda TaxID=252184 RepID=A0AA40CHD7_9PEZI|nr:hypothetical protein B0T17DRAFT_588201 [Bombardia bombarda]
MAPKPSWIIKAPRVILVLIFPTLSFIFYLILALGCSSNTLSTISPIIVRSNGTIPIGGIDIVVDLRIGIWGICLGPSPPFCTSTLALQLPPLDQPQPQTPQTSATILSTRPPRNRGGGNLPLARLALALQATLSPLSGIPLLIAILLTILATSVQLYFNARGRAFDEEHVQAAVWARSLDWAAAAFAVGSYATYRALVEATPRLVLALLPVLKVEGSDSPKLIIEAGSVASSLFAAVVGTTVAGAFINTFMTAGDAGASVVQLGRARRRVDALMGRKAGDGGDDDRVVAATAGAAAGDKFAPVLYRPKPAYERFP